MPCCIQGCSVKRLYCDYFGNNNLLSKYILSIYMQMTQLVIMLFKMVLSFWCVSGHCNIFKGYSEVIRYIYSYFQKFIFLKDLVGVYSTNGEVMEKVMRETDIIRSKPAVFALSMRNVQIYRTIIIHQFGWIL